MSKSEIIIRGEQLGVDFALTHSCYDPDPSGKPCGRCDSCRIRLNGFADASLTDPVEYAKQ
jgi:7-cyano-7-deazaguanine synthase